MKRITFPVIYFPIGLILCILSACSTTSSEIITVDPEYREYISGYSSGMLSRNETIRIELVDPIPNNIKGKKLQKLVSIEPAVKGKVTLVGDRILDFVPYEPLPSGQFYTVKLELDKVTDTKLGYEDFQFQFSTFKQDLDVSLEGFRSYNQYEVRYQQYNATVSTRDFVEDTDLKKTINVSLDGKVIPFDIEPIGGYENEWSLTIDSIRRNDKERELVIAWNGKSIRSKDSGYRKIKVPAIGDFTVQNVNTYNDDDQYIEVHFGEPIRQGQNLNGLIRLISEGGNEVEGLTFSTDYNIVRVYLPNRKEGMYKLICSSGIRNTADGKMLKSTEDKVKLTGPSPKVRVLGSGSILPNSQGLIFPFEAVALKAVDVRIIKIHEKNVQHFLQVNDLDGDDELTRFGKIVAENKVRLDYDKSVDLEEWNTHVINLEKWIKAEPGAIYQVAIRFNKTYTTCDCNEEEESDFEPKTNEGWNEDDWHEYGFDGYSTWSYRSEDSPCSDSYYYGRAVKRNILASDIGMVFKLDVDKKSTAFLTNMLSAEPMANVEVAYYDYTTKLITKGRTNDQGMFTTKLSRKPFLLIAKKGSQRGYLKLRDGNTNSMSRFDVSGENAEEGIKGFIYAERGVWRPGDSMYVNFMLQDKKDILPNSHPVNFELRDPSGNILYNVSRNTHVNGVYDFRTATSADGRTGNYTATVTVGNYTYTKNLKVETVKPNRLKIDLDADASNQNDSATIQAEWLHGAKADGLHYEVELQLSPMYTTFDGYKDYDFDSPLRNGGYNEFVLAEGDLDENGKATFSSVVSDIKDAAGMLRANYITKVYEKGGDYSIDRKTASYSPYDAYVGIKIPKGSQYDLTLETEKKHRFSFATLSKSGKLLGKRKLHLSIYKVEVDWWYDGSTRTVNSYTFKESSVVVRDTVLYTSGGKVNFDYSVPKHSYGKYLFVVRDEESGHEAGTHVHFDWSYWSRANRDDADKATMLTFSTDKSSYTKGEPVKVTIPSPSEGRALISVETSQEVVKKFWIKLNKGETTHEFVTTADMAPNAFIHVTMIQPHHSTKNDLPIRMYGVKPITVDDPYTHLHPVITMKDEIRPESTAKINVKEKNGRKMTYTLAIVDEGLLNLTNFGTPQPWNTFYAKEALGVQTWDMYDDVIGAFSGSLDHMLSVGGDGSAIVGNGPKANRFPPMVRYVGPFEIPAGGSKTHSIDIPSYIGSVRVMVVARDKESYGNAQKQVKVKKPLMVLATLPRVLGPGEEFSLPVDVFAMEKHIKNVKVSIEVNDMFKLGESNTKSIEFIKEGDEVIDFKLSTKGALGVGKVKIRAVSGNEVATQEIEIDIRPSNPYVYETHEIQLEPGKSIDSEIDFDGITGSQSATIEVSTVPTINLEKRMKYLIEYPHGCVEQTTSSVFPQLFLSSLRQLDQKTEKEIEENVKAGISRLQFFQTYEGGFAYWPGESYESEWGTNYAGHFLLEAEAMGYKLPSGMKQRWIEYQQLRAGSYDESGRTSNSSNQLTQAYRLYLLALCGNPDIGAMNRLKESLHLSDISAWRLATAYAQIGQIETAKSMVKNRKTTMNSYTELAGTFGSQTRDKAIILEAQSFMKLQDDASESVRYLSGELSSDNWMSTQETAYALLAVARYTKISTAGGSSKLEYSIDGKSQGLTTIGKKVQILKISEKSGTRKLTLKNAGSSKLFITVTTRKIPKPGNEKNSYSRMKMNVWYEDMDGKRINPEKIKQGTEFVAMVELKNISGMDYKQMALNQIFPSGWEVYNSRLFGGSSSGQNVRYRDIRDDRVTSYYHIDGHRTTLIKVQLHATYKGKFYLPAIYTEAMYDHTIHAQQKGRWVEVL